MNKNNLAINLQDIKFSYNKKTILQINAWQLKTGDNVFIYGKSGSGKTTLLNLLCGINIIDSGNLNILGTELAKLSKRRRDKFRAQNIGVVFQEFNLIPYLSIWDNINLGAYFANNQGIKTKEFATEIFAKLNLDKKILTQSIGTLSVGQRQRVAIARALINAPKLLIADEPTSALDSENRDEFIELLHAVCAQYQTSLVFVSHDLSLGKHFKQQLDLAAINQIAAQSKED